MESKDVVNNLTKIFHEHRLAHAYLFETNNVDNCYKDILKLVKNMVCPLKNVVSECTNVHNCNLCYLIDNNSLPSLITIEPDGKTIKKEAIETLKKAFNMMPIYTESNIYILKYPEKMNNTAFNKMLKFIEEPEANLYGFFICENKDKVAATIVSRCEIIKVIYDDGSEASKLGINEDVYKELTFYAENYISKLEDASTNLIWYNVTELSNILSTREDCINFLKIMFNLYLKQLEPKNENNSKDFKNMLIKIDIIKKYLEELNYNVNVDLMLNSFIIEMGDACGK